MDKYNGMEEMDRDTAMCKNSAKAEKKSKSAKAKDKKGSK